jgi:hypothetical protein
VTLVSPGGKRIIDSLPISTVPLVTFSRGRLFFAQKCESMMDKAEAERSISR